jgi:hypothetical protein
MRMNQSNGFKIEEYKGYECSIQLFCGFYEVFKMFLSKNDLKFRFIMSKNLVAWYFKKINLIYLEFFSSCILFSIQKMQPRQQKQYPLTRRSTYQIRSPCHLERIHAWPLTLPSCICIKIL